MTAEQSPDVVDAAISAFEARKRELIHHTSCTTSAAPQRTDDWQQVTCPTCLAQRDGEP